MSLLDQLWDDTVAGPRPDTGLGMLRKHSTFSFRSSSVKETNVRSPRSYGDEATDDTLRVTRSIMIMKPQRNQNESPPVSPAGSTPPVSPFAAGSSVGRDSFRFRRRSASDAYEKGAGIGPKLPHPPCDM